VRIAGECDSITYCNHNIRLNVDKHCFSLNYSDINYVEYAQHTSSLILIVFLDIMIMEVRQ